MTTDTEEEIVALLAAHSGEPVDYVAVVTLLNTVAGGHYEERHSEEAVQAALLRLLQSGRIESLGADGAAAPETLRAATGQAVCTFRLVRVAA